MLVPAKSKTAVVFIICIYLGKIVFRSAKMNETKVNTFFVSEKISKVRWVPEELKESERFLTGSWDMPSNTVRLWRLQQNQYADDFNEFTPRCDDKIQFADDITGIELISQNIAAVSCADGHVTLLEVKRAVDEDSLKKLAESPLLHKFEASGKSAPCTDISVYDKDIATVGEDGNLNIIDTNTVQSVRVCKTEESCAFTSVVYVNPKEILVGNRMGAIKVFDVRVCAENTLSAVLMVSSQDEKSCNYVSSLASHPTQPHIILAAAEEGSITVWDLRQTAYPASYLSAHASAITEVGFHRSDPTKVLTAAECGELWLWTQYPTIEGVHKTFDTNKAENQNPWLNGERAKNRINVTSLISDLRKPINSFDARGNKIICGSDSEAVYFIDNTF